MADQEHRDVTAASPVQTDTPPIEASALTATSDAPVQKAFAVTGMTPRAGFAAPLILTRAGNVCQLVLSGISTQAINSWTNFLSAQAQAWIEANAKPLGGFASFQRVPAGYGLEGGLAGVRDIYASFPSTGEKYLWPVALDQNAIPSGCEFIFATHWVCS